MFNAGSADSIAVCYIRFTANRKYCEVIYSFSFLVQGQTWKVAQLCVGPRSTHWTRIENKITITIEPSRLRGVCVAREPRRILSAKFGYREIAHAKHCRTADEPMSRYLWPVLWHPWIILAVIWCLCAWRCWPPWILIVLGSDASTFFFTSSYCSFTSGANDVRWGWSVCLWVSVCLCMCVMASLWKLFMFYLWLFILCENRCEHELRTISLWMKREKCRFACVVVVVAVVVLYLYYVYATIRESDAIKSQMINSFNFVFRENIREMSSRKSQC